MARPVDAPLGPPAEISPVPLQGNEAAAQGAVPELRPEIASAKRGVERSEAALDAVRTEATVPSITVGADYWYQPTSEVHHAYGAMVSINLPWLSGGRRDRVREAEHALAADMRALESARNAALFDLRDAQARLKAAQQSYRIIDGDLLPQARQSFESARAAFAAGKGDALGLLDAARSYLQVRVEHARALARLGSSSADLERAVGADATGPALPVQEIHQ